MRYLMVGFVTLILLMTLSACEAGETQEGIVVPEAGEVAETPAEEAPGVEAPAVAEEAVAEEVAVPNVLRGTALAGYNVTNTAGENLGNLEDMMVTLQDGQLDYLVLTFGGFLGMGTRHFLIPWEVVEVVPEANAFVTDVLTQESLDNAPALQADAWPDTAVPEWDAEVIAYWQSLGAAVEREPVTPAETEEVTDTEEVTETEEVTATEEVTGAEAVVDTEEVTGTEEMTDTEEVTETEEVTATEEVTGAEAVVDTEEMTETEEVTDTEEVTGAEAVVETEEVTGTEEMTETEAVTPTTETDGELTVQLPRSVRLTVLLGYTARNPAGDELGELEDLMVNWREGRVAYAVLSLGGFLGMGDKWFAVPLSALTINPVEQTVVIDVDREMLDVAPGFDRDNWPDVANPDWDQEIRQYWEEWQRGLEQLDQPPVGEPGVLPDVPDAEEGAPEAPATPSQ